MLGSRSLEKAKSAVDEIISEKNRDYIKNNLKSAENVSVASGCDILILTVPHENALETVRSLSARFRGNQTLISAVASVTKKGEEFTSSNGSNGMSYAQKINEVVPGSVKVAAAFQTVPANILYREKEISADVPVVTNEPETYHKVASIVSEIDGLRPLYLGSLRLSGEVERLTALLLNIGKRNGLKSPTISFPSF
jgi:8-hydroxy-5-deazaflavin:NADPH oxidoreductase